MLRLSTYSNMMQVLKSRAAGDHEEGSRFWVLCNAEELNLLVQAGRAGGERKERRRE